MPGELGLNGLTSSFFDGKVAEPPRLGTFSEEYGFLSKYACGCMLSLNAPPLVAFLWAAISFYKGKDTSKSYFPFFFLWWKYKHKKTKQTTTKKIVKKNAMSKKLEFINSCSKTKTLKYFTPKNKFSTTKNS